MNEIVMSLPKILQNIVAELEDYKRQGEWVMYDGVSEGLEAIAKQCFADGAISKSEYKYLLKNYC